jgi:hypothetical protein
MSNTRAQPARRPTDSMAMREAIDWLCNAGIPFIRPTDWQLKIGPLNFYPDKGTIHRDGNRRPHPERWPAPMRWSGFNVSA